MTHTDESGSSRRAEPGAPAVLVLEDGRAFRGESFGAPGTTIVAAATRNSSADEPGSAAARTANGVSATTTPDTPRSGATALRGSMRSAARPPAHEPAAIAARARPMTVVDVSSVSPR